MPNSPRVRRYAANPQATRYAEGSLEASLADSYDALHPDDPDGPRWRYAEVLPEVSPAPELPENQGAAPSPPTFHDDLWTLHKSLGLGGPTGNPDTDSVLRWALERNYPDLYWEVYDRHSPPVDQQDRENREQDRLLSRQVRGLAPIPTPRPTPKPPMTECQLGRGTRVGGIEVCPDDIWNLIDAAKAIYDELRRPRNWKGFWPPSPFGPGPGRRGR